MGDRLHFLPVRTPTDYSKTLINDVDGRAWDVGLESDPYNSTPF